MALAHSPKLVTDKLMFGVDFGNPKSNSVDFVNNISYTSSNMDFELPTISNIENNGGVSRGYVKHTSSGYVEFNSSKYSTYDMSNGFSAFIILDIDGFSSLGNAVYKGILGKGNSYTDRLINLWFYKASGSLHLHQSANPPANNGYVGTLSNSFTAPSDGTIFMVGYSHNATNSITYYLHGRPLSTHSVAAIRTTWPSRNDLYVCGGSNTSAYYFTSGKVYKALVYNKELTATEMLQNYNAVKGRFGL